MQFVELLEFAKFALIIFNVLIAIILMASKRSLSAVGPQKLHATTRKGSVLIVTAHPDDEAMFFAPTMLSLIPERKMHLLCLSNGDYVDRKEGEIRSKELQASGKVLGVKEDCIHVIDDEELKDGPQQVWNVSKIERIVAKHVADHCIETLITFDERGVSGHANHIAVYEGVKRFMSNHKPDASGVELRAFKLDSTNILRKYIGLLDVLLCQLWSPVVYTSPYLCFWGSHRAMSAHQSQYVWFRRLFVIFSRYSYVNTLSPI